MAIRQRFLLLLCIYSVTGCRGLQWSPPVLAKDEVITVCENDDVIIMPWNVVTATGETITAIKWFSVGRSEELFAVRSQGHLSVQPTFAGRVEAVPGDNAGLVVRHVTSGESGHFSVEVNALDAGGQPLTLRRRVSVRVEKGLQTLGGHLTASLLPQALYSNITDQWHATLACGSFLPSHRPPFDLQWTLPSEQTVSSTGFQDGHFLLLLDNPVVGGSYTCHLPPSAPVSPVCLHGNHASSGRATVDVGGTLPRLILIEAQQAALVAENGKLKDEVRHFREESAQQHPLVTQNCSCRHDNYEALLNITERLARDNQALQETAARQNQSLTRLSERLSAQQLSLTHQVQQQITKVTQELTRENQQLTARLNQQHQFMLNMAQQHSQGNHATEHQLGLLEERLDNITNNNKASGGSGCCPTSALVLQLQQELRNVTVRLTDENGPNTLQQDLQMHNMATLLATQNQQVHDLTIQVSHNTDVTHNLTNQLKAHNQRLDGLAHHAQLTQSLTNQMSRNKQHVDNLTNQWMRTKQELEANLTQARARVNDVVNLMSSEHERLSNLTRQMTHVCEDTVRQYVGNLTHTASGTHYQGVSANQIGSESQRLTTMENLVKDLQAKRVSFNARGLSDYNPHSGATLRLPAVYDNHGNGYDPATGVFTAVYGGTYLFMASMGTSGKDQGLSVYLMVDHVSVDYVNTHSDAEGHPQAASLQAVVHVRAGGRVWLSSTGTSHFGVSFTSFSGVLVNPDA